MFGVLDEVVEERLFGVDSVEVGGADLVQH